MESKRRISKGILDLLHLNRSRIEARELTVGASLEMPIFIAAALNLFRKVPYKFV